MAQSRKSTPPKAASGRSSRGMSEGTKPTSGVTKKAAQRPTEARAMNDRPRGIDKSQKTAAKTRRTTRAETDSE